MPSEGPYAGLSPNQAFSLAVAHEAQRRYGEQVNGWVRELANAFEYDPRTRRYYLDECKAALLGLAPTTGDPDHAD